MKLYSPILGKQQSDCDCSHVIQMALIQPEQIVWQIVLRYPSLFKYGPLISDSVVHCKTITMSSGGERVWNRSGAGLTVVICDL